MTYLCFLTKSMTYLATEVQTLLSLTYVTTYSWETTSSIHCVSVLLTGDVSLKRALYHLTLDIYLSFYQVTIFWYGVWQFGSIWYGVWQFGSILFLSVFRYSPAYVTKLYSVSISAIRYSPVYVTKFYSVSIRTINKLNYVSIYAIYMLIV